MQEMKGERERGVGIIYRGRRWMLDGRECR
jgi:hypothetical protein